MMNIMNNQNQLTHERLVKILSETQATITEHNSRCVCGSVEVDARLFEAILMELQERRKAEKDSKPVVWDYEWASCITCEGPQNFKRVLEREVPPEWAIDEGQARNIIPLYRHVSSAPVIPDGYALVPIEPTESMIIDGFESEPDKFFSKPWEWDEYQAMSGCQQAAHKARLCWSAMLAAAPKYEPK